MIPLDYWLLRSIRRNIPQAMIDFMLDHGLYLKPGADTSEPERVARRYEREVAGLGAPLEGRSVCFVGYGGSIGIGLHLLEQGATRVILQDPFAPERSSRNQGIERDLRRRHGNCLEIVHEHLDAYAARHPGSVDIIISNSVLEHVADIDRVVGACARLMSAEGLNLHYIDLRDHFFKYPFEMLCYSEQIWRQWLNASNNLNRLRILDYERAFACAFDDVRIEVISHLREEFRRTQVRIRNEFLTGDEAVDAAAHIRVEARR